METPIYLLPQSARLKVVPNMVRIHIYEDGKLLDKFKVQYTKFKKNTAKDLVLAICPSPQEKIKSTRVHFNYYGVDVPESAILVPETQDEVSIFIKTIKNSVEVRIIDEKEGREIGYKIF